MKLALPDLVSNSYFPALAAVELGFFRDEGLDVAHELVFPVSASFAALRDGACDFVAGSSHAGLAAFPGFKGHRLLCALSHGMYWFLVMRKNLGIERGDLTALRGMKLVAAPMVDVGLRLMLRAGGMDPAANDITIMPLPGGVPHGMSFGVAAAEALHAGVIDGFWANGMGAEVAVERGAGSIVIDVRRGDGPAAAFGFTQPALAASERLVAEKPEAAAAAVRAIVRTHRALKADIGLAVQVGKKLFPAFEAGLIGRLIQRDLPYYNTVISRDFIASMNRFAIDAGMLDAPVAYEDIVAPAVETLWDG